MGRGSVKIVGKGGRRQREKKARDGTEKKATRMECDKGQVPNVNRNSLSPSQGYLGEGLEGSK